MLTNLNAFRSIILAAPLVAVIPAKAQQGELDSNFGNDGIVITDLGPGNAQCNRSLIAPDGSIYSTGSYFLTPVNADFELVKYHEDGSLDTSFGTMGMASTPIGTGNDYCLGATLQSDGKILLCGEYDSGIGYNFALVRFMPNGTLDASFGIDGISTVDMGPTVNFGSDVVVQPDGKIVLVGTHLEPDPDFIALRFDANGVLDANFGTGGIVVHPVGSGDNYCYAAALQSDGKILLVGAANSGAYSDIAMERLTTSGDLDPTFGDSGIAIRSASPANDYGYAVLLDPDGKIVVAGKGDAADPDFLIARFGSDGSFDTSFGSNGKTFLDFGGNDIGLSVARQSDGKYLVGGGTFSLGYEVARFGSDGMPDLAFGTDGKVTTSTGAVQYSGRTVLVDGEQRILLSGYAVAAPGDDFVLIRYLSGLETGIPAQDAPASAVSVYPDPISTGTVVDYRLERSSTVTITLFNFNGQIVAQPMRGVVQSAGAHSQSLSYLEDLSSGTYSLIVATDHWTERISVIKP